MKQIFLCLEAAERREMKSKMQNERIEILHVGGSGLKVMQIEKFLLGVKVALM